MKRNKATKRKTSRSPRLSNPSAAGWAEAVVWVLLATVWWYHDIELKDAFRLPKLVLSESLALLSVAFLSWRLRQLPRLAWQDVWNRPAVRIALPMLAVAALGLVASSHPAHVRRALGSLAIGLVVWVAWSDGFGRRRLDRLLAGTLLPAVALAAVGVLQFHGIYRPFDFSGDVEGERLGVTSFAGSAGDLAVFLVLPCLIAQERLWRARGRRRVPWAVALAICLYAVAVTQTLTALAALVLGSLVLWAILLPRRQAAAVAAALAVAATVAVVGVAPLRERVWDKGKGLLRGDLNAVLTGRLDGWRAAGWMFLDRPVTGVGHGAYRVEFARAKLALAEEGVDFLRNQEQVMFVNAHNEPLEVVAEWGLAGIVVLAWGGWVFFGVLRRRYGPDAAAPQRALAWSGMGALVVLSLAQFPFRLALVAYPTLIFLSWVLAEEETP